MKISYLFFIVNLHDQNQHAFFPLAVRNNIAQIKLLFLLLLTMSLFSCKKDYVKPPVVLTEEVTNVSSTTAISGGTVIDKGGSPVISMGVCWDTYALPTINNSKTVEKGGSGTFVSTITSLVPNTTYYVRAYATNSAGTRYGNQVILTTRRAAFIGSNLSLPTVETSTITLISGTYATGGGNITNSGGAHVTARGVCWSTTVDPTISDSKTSDGTGDGTFTSSITGLNLSTRYYVRAYAINSQGTAYGSQVDFITTSSDHLAGGISGIVTEASESVPIQNVTISVFLSNVLVATGTSQSDGRFEINISGNTGYRVVFSKPGYLNVEYKNVNVASGEITFLEPVFQIYEEYSGNGNISGTIKDALTGTGIPGVTLKLRSGINVTSGEIVSTATTNFSGLYLLSGVPAGNYTIEAIKSGFTTTYFSVICLGDQTVDSQDATMSPILSIGETRIVLTWGESPSDLDSHFTGPLSDGSRFHMWYAYSDFGDSPWPQTVVLDLDDTDSYGPETTTLFQQIGGIYRFSVHDYDNSGSDLSFQLSNSGAKVKVYKSSGLVATFNVPQNTGGTLWTVFEMSGNTIIPINQMTYQSDESEISKGVYKNPDVALFNNLPKK